MRCVREPVCANKDSVNVVQDVCPDLTNSYRQWMGEFDDVSISKALARTVDFEQRLEVPISQGIREAD